MKSIRPRFLVIAELVYSTVYVALAFIAARGNSPDDSCPLFLAPLATLFLLIIALILSADVGTYRNRVFFLWSMIAHYLITLIAILTGFSDIYPRYFVYYWKGHSAMTLLIVGWYLGGQIFHWFNYINELKLQKFEEGY